MRPTLALAAAAAAVASLASCMCTDVADTRELPVTALSTATLSALYAPIDAGTFRADVQVLAGECTEVPDGTAADVGGVALEPQGEGESCACETSRFLVDGAEIPAATDGTFRVADGSGEMSATVPALFVPPTVALRAPSTALRVGTRVYLDFAPANGTITEVTGSFRPFGTYADAFAFATADGTLGQDEAGFYLDVPASAAAEGELVVTTRAELQTSSCLGAARCDVVATATRRLDTAVVE